MPLLISARSEQCGSTRKGKDGLRSDSATVTKITEDCHSSSIHIPPSFTHLLSFTLVAPKPIGAFLIFHHMKRKGNETKNKFRRSKAWRDFRKRLIEERGSCCECCGKKTKLLQCHHMDESLEHYEDLSDPSKFKLLCSQCHRCAESLAQIKKENWYKIRRKEWVDFYKQFLI